MAHDLEVIAGGSADDREHVDTTNLDTSLLAAFDSAVAAATWIADADRAAVTAGRAIAATVDAILCDDMASHGEKSKALYLIPHLRAVLNDLGLTPVARGTFAKAAPVGEETDDERRLREFQARAQQAAAAGRRAG